MNFLIADICYLAHGKTDVYLIDSCSEYDARAKFVLGKASSILANLIKMYQETAPSYLDDGLFYLNLAEFGEYVKKLREEAKIISSNDNKRKQIILELKSTYSTHYITLDIRLSLNKLECFVLDSVGGKESATYKEFFSICCNRIY